MNESQVTQEPMSDIRTTSIVVQTILSKGGWAWMAISGGSEGWQYLK